MFLFSMYVFVFAGDLGVEQLRKELDLALPGGSHDVEWGAVVTVALERIEDQIRSEAHFYQLIELSHTVFDEMLADGTMEMLHSARDEGFPLTARVRRLGTALPCEGPPACSAPGSVEHFEYKAKDNYAEG